VRPAHSNRITIAALILAAATVVVAVGADVARARPYETFTLESHDKVIEAPGCYASCSSMGARRTCTLKEMDCKVVCATIPECRPDGMNAVKVCAIVKERVQ
jgi:branched-subunit amino acid transport protein AzlD